jgi:transcriptional regulator with XRE-family HTH domain
MISRSILREQLGKKLGAIRNREKVSGRKLAFLLGVRQSTISKLENGKLNPSDEFLNNFIRIFHLNDEEADELRELIEKVSDRLHRIKIGKDAEFTRMQKLVSALEYDELRMFQMSLIPGPLQTRAYTHAIFFTDVPTTYNELAIKSDLETAMHERIEQTKKLYNFDKKFTFLIHENALRTRVCLQKQAIDQIEHIKLVSQQPHIEVGIIPWYVNYFDLNLEVPQSNFDLYDNKLLSIQLDVGFVNIWDEELIEQYNQYFLKLKRAAVFKNALYDELDRIIHEIRCSCHN